ncbi:hypothetical protein O77CONTIG1_03140 [Leptolyngbya sp. O-77]|nr:hypothetical protein O77CONTIG1_03140 [Leptolyngbya sp. O-77]
MILERVLEKLATSFNLDAIWTQSGHTRTAARPLHNSPSRFRILLQKTPC